MRTYRETYSYQRRAVHPHPSHHCAHGAFYARLPDPEEQWQSPHVAGRGIKHPGNGLWTGHLWLTWGDMMDAHASLTSLAGSCFHTPDDDRLATFDADLERYRAAAVLRETPGARCAACWASSCPKCGQVMTGLGVEHDHQGRMVCADCKWGPSRATGM